MEEGFGKNSGIIRHEKSESHLNALMMYESFISQQINQKSISNIIDKTRIKIIEQNRHIMTISKIIRNLAISESAFRGHNEDIDSTYNGKFLMWLKTIAEHHKLIKQRIECGPNNAKYISSKIQNEIIEVFKNYIHKKIINEVKEAKYYSIIADSTRDITNCELMSISIRFIHKNVIRVRFLGFIHEENLNAENKC